MSKRVRVELRHLRYFVTVAAHGSFNRAAQVLHLTQPALSRQVRDLEDELGVALLVRGKNAVKLTDAGECFYSEASDVIARAELAVQRVRNETSGEVLRVGYSPSVTAGILPRALQNFQAEYPKVRIELTDASPMDMVQMATEGRLDIAIALEPAVMATPGFRWTELRRLTHVLVMRADHPLTKWKRIAPSRLRDVPLVGLEPSNFPDYVPHIRSILKPYDIEPHFVSLETDGVSTLFASLEAFDAAAILADSVIDFMPRSLVSRPFHPKFEPLVAKIGLSSTYPKAHAELFANLLRREARQN
ncbi:LysR substrate-binding domain-containing protein [Ruficoccus sp. ZRK36]|uniref:LysR substrate-binding domain-containing protein n=1 Tax=Ruficoccus sp. ZRK36 TaxID=2866311 RepID=UPI001C72B8E1|nr:LysR substrate-binding domain-containing protein [Ruficoccus sp. ZRK36]QYY35203.1 LysR family transcriptional regulator [Ruficoccus sp. ZRK36]